VPFHLALFIFQLILRYFSLLLFYEKSAGDVSESSFSLYLVIFSTILTGGFSVLIHVMISVGLFLKQSVSASTSHFACF
jgi:hypothetical protein